MPPVSCQKPSLFFFASEFNGASDPLVFLPCVSDGAGWCSGMPTRPFSASRQWRKARWRWKNSGSGADTGERSLPSLLPIHVYG